NYEVSGRTFRTKQDYYYACKDAEAIKKIKKNTDWNSIEALQKLFDALENNTYHFNTLLGDDFTEEVEEQLEELKKNPPVENKKKQSLRTANKSTNDNKRFEEYDASMQLQILSELKKQERKRKMTIFILSILAAACLSYVGVYFYQFEKNKIDYSGLAELKKDIDITDTQASYTITLEEEKEKPPILAKYETLYKKNKKLIGWLKIDDTNIDYPVMQTVNNEYYLDHNFNQEYDKNGSLFLDKDCNAAFPNTNMIIYGHHMKSGKMFGNLNYYSKESYYKEHPRIQFDTIYEEGLYDIMYVFRSRIYNEDEVVFKYYKFLDVNSEDEFYSAMDEMARMSLYDTGVTAAYGDKLITLSTCDSSEEDGRFVVVAKKIK
ncbi:MAG: class B sortase, partial [Lachnospiraceae bacterium]|nr:class B sortase [Lachnospiraceae bacterium]